MEEEIEVWIGNRLIKMPKADYLDMKARQYGFEDYNDLKENGLNLE